MVGHGLINTDTSVTSFSDERLVLSYGSDKSDSKVSQAILLLPIKIIKDSHKFHDSLLYDYNEKKPKPTIKKEKKMLNFINFVKYFKTYAAQQFHIKCSHLCLLFKSSMIDAKLLPACRVSFWFKLAVVVLFQKKYEEFSVKHSWWCPL